MRRCAQIDVLTFCLTAILGEVVSKEFEEWRQGMPGKETMLSFAVQVAVMTMTVT
jgi:hypothetical protein